MLIHLLSLREWFKVHCPRVISKIKIKVKKGNAVSLKFDLIRYWSVCAL
jgi:hypothetical protein